MQLEQYDSMFQKSFSFWNHLTIVEKEQFCRQTIAVKYKKGFHVHSGNEDCVGVLLVKSGQLRVYMLSEDGRDITLYRLFEGEVCILSASCVLETITFDVFIDAEDDTEVLLVDAAVFRRIAEKNVYVECFGYRLATMRFSDVMWAMQQILFMGVDKRLAIFLLEEMNKNKTSEIKLTQEQIARYIGSAREVVTRMLKYFAEDKTVELFRGGVRILDQKKLQTLKGV